MSAEKKTILILGGTKNQVPLIQAAKLEGYRVIVCDWTSDNPGLEFADKHYQISTLDRDAVLRVARKEQIDGIISNSETAMLTVAYIATQLGLMGNSVEGIEILSSKDKFRTLQEKLGQYAPKHRVTNSIDEYYHIVDEIGFPLIVKPVECTGTRGTTKVNKWNREVLDQAFHECIYYSNNGNLTVEEYVEMPSLTLIDGDVFLVNGAIIWDGMFFSSRSVIAPMVPMTQSFPLKLEEPEMQVVKNELDKIFTGAGIVFGEYNVEMYFNQNRELFIIEINARQGGNGIPKMIEAHCGINMYRLLVTTAVRDFKYYKEIMKQKRDYKFVSRFPVFSRINGKYKKLYIDPIIEKFIMEVEEIKQQGDEVERVRNAMSVVAFVSLKFDSYEQQHFYIKQLENLIYPELIEV